MASGFLISDFFRSGVIAFSTMLLASCCTAPRRRVDRRGQSAPSRQVSKEEGFFESRFLFSGCVIRGATVTLTLVTNTAELATLRGEHLARVDQLDHAVGAPPARLPTLLPRVPRFSSIAIRTCLPAYLY